MEDAREYSVDELFSLGENHDVEHDVISEAVELDLMDFTVQEVLNVQLLEGNVTAPDVYRINHEEEHALANEMNLPAAEENLNDLYGNLKELQAHLLSDDGEALIRELSQDQQNTMLLDDVPGADSMQFVCGESQRDGDESVKETFPQVEVGYAASEVPWTTFDDLNGTWFAGCGVPTAEEKLSDLFGNLMELQAHLLSDDGEALISEAVELDLMEHDCNFTVEEVLHVQLLEGNVTAPDVYWINHEEEHAVANEMNLPTAEEKLSDVFGNLKELQAHLLSDGGEALIRELSQDQQNTRLLDDVPGAASMQFVCGESQRDGDESVKETFHHVEVGYAASEFPWTTFDDFNGTWFAGCGVAQPQADSEQTCYSAFYQCDLESGERMLMCDTPGPLQILDPIECIQFSDLPADLYERSEDLQADCGVIMDNFHDEPAWPASSGGSLHECAHANEAIPVGDNMVKRAADQSLLESKPRLKRRKKLAFKSYVGVKRRCNGNISSFEANYAPPGSDGQVFLGEFSTPEEAKDAYNLVALLREGVDARIDLEPYKVERYLHEVQEWQGKHIVDLVCKLRLKGRGVDKDEHGTWTNYKHVIRCWSKRKQVMKFEGKVSLECTLLDGLTKKRKCTSKSFDTAEEAAKHADMVQVEKRGKHAWTNFPLSTYINSLEKDFLPITVITRSDRTYYRAASSVDSNGGN